MGCASQQSVRWLSRRAGVKPPAILSRREAYFFLATLRVFFAVFFTALFAFLTFF
ncbi:MAG: hypothetical protein ACI9HH_003168, partial [Pseudomonadota bacterium]